MGWKMKLLSMADLGQSLPIGIDVPAGGRDRSLGFRPWRTKQEREISEWRTRNKKATQVELVTWVMGHMCTRLGPHDLDVVTNEHERARIVRSMWASDVLAAWIQLRRHVLGDGIDTEMECPECAHRFPYEIDLGTVDVWVPDEGEALEWEHEPSEGVLLGDTTFQTMQMKPLEWATFSRIRRSDADPLALRLAMIAGSVASLDGQPFAVTPDMLDMTKKDLETLADEIGKHVRGVDMQIDVPCPKCGETIEHGLLWVYDSFFSAKGSSASGRTRRGTESSSSSATMARAGSSST